MLHHDNAQSIATGSSSVPHFQIAENEMTTAASSDFEYGNGGGKRIHGMSVIKLKGNFVRKLNLAMA